MADRLPLSYTWPRTPSAAARGRLHPGPAQGRAAPAHRGHPRAGADVRHRPPQRGPAAIPLGGRRPPRLPVLEPAGFPRHLLRRREGPARGARLLRPDLGVPGAGARRRRPARRDLLRPADPHRPRGGVRDRRDRHSPRPGRRGASAADELRPDTLLPAVPQRRGRGGHARGGAALQGVDRRGRARFVGGGSPAVEVPRRIRPGAGGRLPDRGARRRGGAARVHPRGPRPAEGTAHRPRGPLPRGPRPGRPPRRRARAAHRLPALQRQAARVRGDGGSPAAADVCGRACASRSAPTTRPISAATSARISARRARRSG